jgi:undecaprenyl-diphosphatase
MLPKLAQKDIKSKINWLNSKTFFMINKQSGKSKIIDYVMITFTLFGDGLYTVPLAFIGLLFINKRKIKPTLSDFWKLTVIMSIGGIIIYLLKEMFQLPRPVRFFTPLIENKSVDVRVLLSQLDGPGFPSGHTYAAFSLATYLYYRLVTVINKKNYSYFVLFYLIASCIAVSRIFVGAHFLTDVIGGIIIGTMYTYTCIYIQQLVTKQTATDS